MQQSSECDSSGRLCTDLDAIALTYRGKCVFMWARECIGVCMCHVNNFFLAGFPPPRGAELLVDVSGGERPSGETRRTSLRLLYPARLQAPSLHPIVPPES